MQKYSRSFPLDEFLFQPYSSPKKLFLGRVAKGTFGYLNGQVQGKLFWAGDKKERKGRRLSESVREKARKPLLGKARHKRLHPPEIPTHRHPSHFTLTSPLKMRALERRMGDEHTKKRIKRGEKRRGKKPTCEVLFVVLARNGEKKKHEEAAKCGGEKGGSEETAPGVNCTKPRQECREAGPLFLRSRRERRDPETRATYLCGEG
nr:uncharacterized protein LOC108176842 [Oryctolagus cuniculus]